MNPLNRRKLDVVNQARSSPEAFAGHPVRPGRISVPKHAMNLLDRAGSTQAPASVLFIRIMVRAVFRSEGIQKFLYRAALGSGRFAEISLPNPEFLGPFVGGFECRGHVR